ncbi:MAG: hypothetical protein JWM51_1958 [Microbacteriaceae bacterium]|nr:hypothetical protein [Microbacteriaceae bacterium]
MSVTLAILLILNGAFNFAVWPTFYRRVARDPRARRPDGKASRFLTVHLVIASIALVLGVVSVLAGILTMLGV